MKTAHEILGGILPLSVWDSWDENLCNCPPHYIIEAMQQYAKQQSIGFAEWIYEKDYVQDIKGWCLSYSDKERLTSSELYQQFLTKQSK